MKSSSSGEAGGNVIIDRLHELGNVMRTLTGAREVPDVVADEMLAAIHRGALREKAKAANQRKVADTA